MTATLRTTLYNPKLWLLMGTFMFIGIYTTRCGDAYR